MKDYEVIYVLDGALPRTEWFNNLLNYLEVLYSKCRAMIHKMFKYTSCISVQSTYQDIEYVFVMGNEIRKTLELVKCMGYPIEYSDFVAPNAIVLEARTPKRTSIKEEINSIYGTASIDEMHNYCSADAKFVEVFYRRLTEQYRSKENNNMLKIKNVIFSNPATIVFWEDGTKTVVKCQDEEFDPEKGLAMAISRKALGNERDYYDHFKRYIGRYERQLKKKKEN